MTDRPLRLGTRGSDLALWQARRVAHLVSTRLDRECSIVIIKTHGDRVQDVAFRKMEGKGFFTKELQEALLDERIDLVVHSLKDLPTEEPEGLDIVAIPERADSSDLLLRRPGVEPLHSDQALALPPGTVVGTSSLRRAAQVLDTAPGVTIRALRGNVPTRIRKLRDGDYDAILVAAAGVERLGLDLSDLAVVPLDHSEMLPAPGQGALAIETRQDDPATRQLNELHDPEVARHVTAERFLLDLLGGGCHLPLGCLATPHEGQLHLQAALGVTDEDVTRAAVTRVDGTAGEPEAVARMCFDAFARSMPEVPAP
jgi:hydroxymethylbilane synthase